MNLNTAIDAILFDLDGTLWDSVDGILLTWNRVISSEPGLRKPIDRAEQETLMGLQMDEIAQRLFPDQPPARQRALMEACMQAENEYLYHHGGILYPDLKETLTALHVKYPLYIISNCQSGYIEAFLHAHRLESLFDGFLCYGDTGKGKAKNIQTVVLANGIQHPVYVGDTLGDQNASEQAGVPFIYAAYGFGESTRWAARIQRFSDLLALIS